MRRTKLAAALIGALAVLAIPATAGAAVGGPVILGGDDQTDHGSVNGSGESELGWIYIEKAIANIKPKVGRTNDNTIAAFGSEDPGTVDSSSGGDAGAAIKNAAAKNGMGVTFFEGSAAITAGFASIQSGAYRPAIIWFAGDQASNDIDSCEGQDSEGAAISANGGVTNSFVNEGGGLMSHGTCYAWLSTLVPGLGTNSSNTGDGPDLYLTPAGQAAFPGLQNSDIGSDAWHNHFEGDLGGLEILVRSNEIDNTAGEDAIVVIGGGQVSLTEKPADLAITKVDSRDPSTAGRNLTYTLKVTNNGPNPATGVTVTDALPSGLTARSSSASQGTCSGTTTVTCALGDLASGASATVTIVVRPSAAGKISNTASVTGSQPDPNQANNSATQETTVSAAPAAVVDRRKPTVSVGGVRAAGCLRAAFTAKVTIKDASKLRRVVVTVDGRTIRRTKNKRFSITIRAADMRSGRHVLRVVATDARGNRRVVSRGFSRCRPPVIAPVFTG
jgi:uncharacterized repeat protein (TIGR01451 family)